MSLATNRIRPPAALRTTWFLAVAWTIFAVIWTIYTVLTDILSTEIPAALDVAPFWRAANPTQKLDGITAAVTGGGYDHASFTISGLGMDARHRFGTRARPGNGQIPSCRRLQMLRADRPRSRAPPGTSQGRRR